MAGAQQLRSRHGLLRTSRGGSDFLGVCEVPGWGRILPASRVLPEMREVGLRATELGAPGFLPEGKEAVKDTLDAAGMTLVGGFVPLVLQDPAQWDVAIENARSAAELFVLRRRPLRDGSRRTTRGPVRLRSTASRCASFAEGLRLIDNVCADFGIVQVLHPHVDTLFVETKVDVELALQETDVKWCLDTWTPRDRRHRSVAVRPRQR